MWGENQFINDEPSVEPSISIPCTVKQPNQPEIQGVIKQDLGSRFLVYIPDSESTVTVSKLFVYPDFSKLDKSSRKNIPASKSGATLSQGMAPSNAHQENCSSKNSIPASKSPPSKTRRQKGEGSGTIFYRTVTRNGRDYQQAYYKWRENGKQKTQYLPNKLLDKVIEAESRKLPVKDILVLLAGTSKCSRKKFDTLDKCSSKKCSSKIIPASKNSVDECSSKMIPASKTIPASKKNRNKGKGTGWIQCKPIKRKGKEYKQYWYHYEEWREGDRLVQCSEYIPKKMETKIMRMNQDKEPVEEILTVLRNRSKRKR